MISRREASAGLISAAVLAGTTRFAGAAEPKIVALPPPDTSAAMPLMQALKLRHSTREYSDKAIPQQVLSDLLWAAFGINRPASGDRTAPYWRHIMVIDVYAAMADGVWFYDPKAHALRQHSSDDIRALTGTQDFVPGAPLNLIFVAHGERMHDVSPADRRLFASVNAGFTGQNVYLYCASQGLGSVFRGAVPYEKLEKAMRLGAGQFVTFCQTVGYPKA